jgi:hypothetical protein
VGSNLSKYRKALIVLLSKGWVTLCRPYPDETKPLRRDELRKLQLRVRELERELEDRTGIPATSKISAPFTTIYSYET